MILIIDTETTGREPPEVIEFAGMEIEQGDWSVRRFPWSTRYSSKFGSAYGALATHHILDEEVKDYEPFDGKASYGSGDYIIGHNIDYDWQALGSPPCKRICTLAMSRNIWPEVDSHSLGAMSYFIAADKRATKELLKGGHGAKTDVLLCYDLLLSILKYRSEIHTAEQLWAFSERSRIPEIWTFGKYKGQSITGTDRGYLQWCLRQPDFDPYVLQAVKKALGR